MSGTLSPQDRQRLQTLFERAADLPMSERAEWVWRECGSHVALRDEIVRQQETFLQAGGRFIVPIPKQEIVEYSKERVHGG